MRFSEMKGIYLFLFPLKKERKQKGKKELGAVCKPDCFYWFHLFYGGLFSCPIKTEV